MKYKFLSLLEMLMIAILISGLSPVNAFDGRDDDSRLKASDTLATATFAGGCFWCMEPPFEALEGVSEVRSGYTGGSMPDPTYNEVASGRSGHLEAIQVRYDPAVISFADLLAVFWQQIDPTDAGGSFVDRGPQYRSAIFYHTESQKQLAEASRRALDESGRFDRPVATEILPVERFYPAEDYHQDYHKTQPLRYKAYRAGSGRDRYIARVWQDDPPPPVCPRPLADTRPDDEELEKRLSPLQYEVTRENGTEPPFRNAYWDNKKPGLYVDVISGEPLFTSADKFDSGTGWPSFTKPVTPEAVVEKTDQSLLMTRTEVRSRQADSHLGHVFTDGPEPTGLRYCINSAALRFIPLEDLEKEGYGEFKKQFETE